MAHRPSVKEILEAARRGGPAKPQEEASEPVVQAEPAAAAPATPAIEEPTEEPAAPEPPSEAAPVAAPAKPLGRPLTLAEKLAAARAGGAAKPAAAPAPKPRAQPAPVAAQAPDAAPEAPAAPAPPAAPLGRPLTLKEKLAAARSGGAGTAAAGAAPAAAKPATASPAASKTAAAPRTLPPLEKITDPRDLAEAARRAAAKVSAVTAKTAEPAPTKPAKTGAKKAEAQKIPPKPQKTAARAAAQPDRRQVLKLPWILLGWATFTAGMAALTAACGRFMFPNVLAEPPSTIKVGLPSDFEPEEVNDRWKTEWGFWIVRSAKYNGQDVIYAIKSVCTHLGCPPNWLASEQKFKCPCHGSGFYITGVNFEGPAPRPLERYKVVLADDGQIMVDKSQGPYQEELGQWTDPDSFIAV